MIRKLTLTALIIGLLLIALTIYVGATISDELKAVQSLLSGPLADLDEGSLQHAEAGLRSAKQRLDDLPVKVLGLLPVAHQNLEAIDAAIDAALPVLESAQELRSTTDRIMTSELVDDGNLDLTLLGGLVGPLDAQTEELAHLEDSLAAGRSGWLLPPVWDAIDQLHRKVSRLLRSAANAADAVRIAESMLGGDEPRTYLVLLMNNAELRGAGGILSSIGTLDIDDGEIRLGRFRHYRELQDEKPYREVEAPPDLERRFGRYRADKTVWVNTTASPDVPEVGLVATRLYELKTGVRVDGAILVDPRGISAMMPKGAVIRIPGGEISSEELPRFVYSDVYERYETGHPGRRRSAVLDVGRRAFQSVVQEGFKNRQSFLSTASAIRAGHIAFFSVESSEQRVLERIGAAGDLEPTATDNLLVTVQNYAADKLDFWMDRSIRHRCAITDGAASCTTEVTLSNEAPLGLPTYVVQEKPSYALYKGYLEIYVPEGAAIESVEIDSVPATYYPEVEDQRRSLGMLFAVERHGSVTAKASYRVPLDGSYSLQVDPQALSNDARLDVELDVPSHWYVIGNDGDVSRGPMHYTGILEETQRFEADPGLGRTGIPAIWDRVVRFWREPVL